MTVGGCGKHGTVCAGLLCTYIVVITPYLHAVLRTVKRRMCLVGVDPEDARYCKPKGSTTINTYIGDVGPCAGARGSEKGLWACEKRWRWG